MTKRICRDRREVSVASDKSDGIKPQMIDSQMGASRKVSLPAGTLR